GGVILRRDDDGAGAAPVEVAAISELAAIGRDLKARGVLGDSADLGGLGSRRIVELPTGGQLDGDLVVLRPAVVEIDVPLALAGGEARSDVALEEGGLEEDALAGPRGVARNGDSVTDDYRLGVVGGVGDGEVADLGRAEAALQGFLPVLLLLRGRPVLELQFLTASDVARIGVLDGSFERPVRAELEGSGALTGRAGGRGVLRR